MFTEIEDIKKLDIRSMMFDELAVWVKAVGQPAFRAKQIFEWVHEKGIADAEEMTNVPKKLIEEIKKQGMHGVEEVTDWYRNRMEPINFYSVYRMEMYWKVC